MKSIFKEINALRPGSVYAGITILEITRLSPKRKQYAIRHGCCGAEGLITTDAIYARVKRNTTLCHACATLERSTAIERSATTDSVVTADIKQPECLHDNPWKNALALCARDIWRERLMGLAETA